MLTRRQLLYRAASGLGPVALTSLLHGKGPLEAKAPHHPAKAKRVVQLFMAGAASHVDLWDYKPALEKHHGEASNFGEHVEAFQDGLGPWMKSPFKFAAYGQSGKFLSDAVEPQ